MGMKPITTHSRHSARKPARHHLRIARRVVRNGSANRSGAPKMRYSPHQRPSGNRVRLMTVVTIFRLTPSEIGKATGFSRSYVSRLLNPKDEFSGSPEFFRVLEQQLGAIIEERSAQYFTVPAVSVARARNVLELAA